MINNFKIFEQTFYKPQKKRPINYMCLNLMKVLNILDKEHKLETKIFWDWERKMMNEDKLNVIFPKPLCWELGYEEEKKKYDNPMYKKAGIEATKMVYTEWRSVIELPKEYDSSKDDDNYKQKKINSIEKFKKMFFASGKKFDVEDENDLVKGINWGRKNFDIINKHLSKIHELYGEHYKNGVIKCFIYDDDYDDRELWGYPMLDFEDKAYFLSELESWIDSFGISTKGLYEWILRCNYIEGRYWQRIWTYDLNSDQNFRKEQPPENIKQINEMLRQLYKNEIEEFPIFIDYYKKVNDNDY